MNNVYDLNVPDDVFEKLPEFTTAELAIAAQALGIAISVSIPILDAMKLVASITPNAKLRKDFVVAVDQIRCGESFKEAFCMGFSGLEALNDTSGFLDICGYGEKSGNLDKALLVYAKNCSEPFSLAQQVGRSNEVQLFTILLATYLKEYSFSRALELCIQRFRGEFYGVLKKICEFIKTGGKISDAFAPHTQWFDPFFLAVIKAVDELPEAEADIKRAFEFLAKP